MSSSELCLPVQHPIASTSSFTHVFHGGITSLLKTQVHHKLCNIALCTAAELNPTFVQSRDCHAGIPHCKKPTSD